jgi:outer membrane protein TolC
LFTGLERQAARAQARAELERLTFVRASVERSIDQQMLVTLHLASASWSGIQQAREAADAAQRNLELITDAYSRGTVAVISLIDAQQSALNAEQGAADAVYAFLTDLMRVERSAGEFHFFRSAGAKAEFLGRLDAFFREAGVQPGQPRRP